MPDVDDTQDGPDAPTTFTAADLEKARREAIEQARREERDKLYSQRDKQKEAFEAMQSELADLKKAEQAREREAAKRAAEAEKAKQKLAEAEMSAKDLLEKRQAEWEAQLAAQRAEQDARLAEIAEQQRVQQAFFEKEREADRLALYTQQAIAANADNIAPELIDLVNGNSQEEIDASIAGMIERTNRIVEGMRQAGLQQRAAMRGTAPASGATGLTPGMDGGAQQLTAEDIRGMSMDDFKALRAKAGIGSNSNRGIFG